MSKSMRAVDAPPNLEMISLRAEAQRIATELNSDWEGFENIYHALRHRAFRRAIEPMLALQARIEGARTIHRIYVSNTVEGFLKIERAPLDPEAQKLMGHLDELIVAEAIRYGIPVSNPVDNDKATPV